MYFRKEQLCQVSFFFDSYIVGLMNINLFLFKFFMLWKCIYIYICVKILYGMNIMIKY